MKLKLNCSRDKKNQSALVRMGWKFLVLWECDVLDKHGSESLKTKIQQFLGSRA
jgi:G:T-mismatch repair DNA endonuclease (very short patch repair protein)